MRPARDPHQRALLAAAARLRVDAEDLRDAWGEDAVRYRRGDREAVVIEGRIYPELTVVADRLCARKPATKALFASVGVPTPAGATFDGADDPALARFLAAHDGPFVVKPAEGTHGDGVLLGVTGVEDVAAHLAAEPPCDGWIVETTAPGADLRIQALGGALVAACVRQPAQVEGDGERSLRGLVAARARAVVAANPHNALVVDDETRALLDAQGVRLDDVPERGRVVVLKRLANMSQGARAFDVTDALHPRWRAYVSRLAGALELGTFALDAMTHDPAADPDEPGVAAVLELNARAEWLHHTFSERRVHDMPALVLRHLVGA